MAHLEYLNPEGLIKSPAFTNAIVVNSPARTIYIGEQNATDANGALVGKGDMKAQTRQVLMNIKIALEAAGATYENVIKWTILLQQGYSAEEGYAVFLEEVGVLEKPPVITVIMVAGSDTPGYLIGMEAIAVTEAN